MDGVPLKRFKLAKEEHIKVNLQLCIICQKGKENEITTSTEFGRENVARIAALKNDIVLKRLNQIGNKYFSYHNHTGNRCYKSYLRVPKKLFDDSA